MSILNCKLKKKITVVNLDTIQLVKIMTTYLIWIGYVYKE